MSTFRGLRPGVVEKARRSLETKKEVVLRSGLGFRPSREKVEESSFPSDDHHLKNRGERYPGPVSDKKIGGGELGFRSNKTEEREKEMELHKHLVSGLRYKYTETIQRLWTRMEHVAPSGSLKVMAPFNISRTRVPISGLPKKYRIILVVYLTGSHNNQPTQ